jgi:hypothetical protein
MAATTTVPAVAGPVDPTRFVAVSRIEVGYRGWPEQCRELGPDVEYSAALAGGLGMHARP